MLPNIFRKCPKIAKNFDEHRKMFRPYTDKFKYSLSEKHYIYEVIDIFTNEDMENTPPEPRSSKTLVSIYYLAMSHKDSEPLNPRNRYWKRCRFSCLDQNVDRSHFAMKKLQTMKCKILTIFFLENNINLWSAKKPDEKKRKRKSKLFKSCSYTMLLAQRIWLSLFLVCMALWLNVQPLNFFLQRILRILLQSS